MVLAFQGRVDVERISRSKSLPDLDTIQLSAREAINDFPLKSGLFSIRSDKALPNLACDFPRYSLKTLGSDGG